MSEPWTPDYSRRRHGKGCCCPGCGNPEPWPGASAQDADRVRWNTALDEHAAGRITDEQLAGARDSVQAAIFARIMTDDRYQERTHG